MPKYLCKAAEVFNVSFGLVISTDVIFEDFDCDFKDGARVELRRPDGSCVQVSARWVRLSPTCFERPMQLKFPGISDAADVPIGTEVWLLESPSDEN